MCLLQRNVRFIFINCIHYNLTIMSLEREKKNTIVNAEITVVSNPQTVTTTKETLLICECKLNEMHLCECRKN